MKFSIYQATRRGGRPSNQDRIAYSYSREALLMVLADGMGGHLHGEVASEITVQFLAEAFQKQAKPLLRDPQTFLKQAFYKAYEAIGRHARAHHFPEIPRTTCIACVVQRDMAYWAHVGDSRLYFFRAGRLLARAHRAAIPGIRDHDRRRDPGLRLRVADPHPDALQPVSPAPSRGSAAWPVLRGRRARVSGLARLVRAHAGLGDGPPPAGDALLGRDPDRHRAARDGRPQGVHPERGSVPALRRSE